MEYDKEYMRLRSELFALVYDAKLTDEQKFNAIVEQAGTHLGIVAKGDRLTPEQWPAYRDAGSYFDLIISAYAPEDTE